MSTGDQIKNKGVPADDSGRVDFLPLTAEDRSRTQRFQQDGERIGRLVDGVETKWHVFRHRDGMLVCWEYLDKDYDDPTEPRRIVTNTTDGGELWKFLPTQ